ncbi:MAG: hypothetical protein ACI3XR_03065 [Eubacteriales bacterium]
MKKFLALILCTVTLLTTLALASCSENTKEYSSSGITVTLPDSFVEKELIGYTYYLQSTDVIFAAVKEEFSAATLIPGFKDYTLKQYADLVVTANLLTGIATVEETDGLTYLTYEKDVSGQTYFYIAPVFKGSDAFWLVNFGCFASDKDEYSEKFIEWAKTIKVD